VRIHGGAPTLSDNRIALNAAQEDGGGIYVSDGAVATIVSNVIEANTANHNGAGIYVQGANARITGNQILSNIADFEGGGIFVGSNVPALINFNSIFRSFCHTHLRISNPISSFCVLDKSPTNRRSGTGSFLISVGAAMICASRAAAGFL